MQSATQAKQAIVDRGRRLEETKANSSKVENQAARFSELSHKLAEDLKGEESHQYTHWRCFVDDIKSAKDNYFQHQRQGSAIRICYLNLQETRLKTWEKRIELAKTYIASKQNNKKNSDRQLLINNELKEIQTEREKISKLRLDLQQGTYPKTLPTRLHQLTDTEKESIQTKIGNITATLHAKLEKDPELSSSQLNSSEKQAEDLTVASEEFKRIPKIASKKSEEKSCCCCCFPFWKKTKVAPEESYVELANSPRSRGLSS